MARPTATAAGIPGFARHVPGGIVVRAPITPMTRPTPATGSQRRSAALPATTPRPSPAASRTGPQAGPEGAGGGAGRAGGRGALSEGPPPRDLGDEEHGAHSDDRDDPAEDPAPAHGLG